MLTYASLCLLVPTYADLCQLMPIKPTLAIFLIVLLEMETSPKIFGSFLVARKHIIGLNHIGKTELFMPLAGSKSKAFRMPHLIFTKGFSTISWHDIIS